MSEEAISRQAAIDVIERWLECSDYNEAERHIMRATESILYDLPSVNPQEPKPEKLEVEATKLQKAYNKGFEDCRQAVISTIYDKKSDFKNDFAQGFFADRIRDLPPVNPQPKTGQWLMPDKEYSNKIWRKCSCCGTHIEKYSKHISFAGEVHYIPYRRNYCPVCGTKMS